MSVIEHEAQKIVSDPVLRYATFILLLDVIFFISVAHLHIDSYRVLHLMMQ